MLICDFWCCRCAIDLYRAIFERSWVSRNCSCILRVVCNEFANCLSAWTKMLWWKSCWMTWSCLRVSQVSRELKRIASVSILIEPKRKKYLEDTCCAKISVTCACCSLFFNLSNLSPFFTNLKAFKLRRALFSGLDLLQNSFARPFNSSTMMVHSSSAGWSSLSLWESTVDWMLVRTDDMTCRYVQMDLMSWDASLIKIRNSWLVGVSEKTLLRTTNWRHRWPIADWYCLPTVYQVRQRSLRQLHQRDRPWLVD